MLNGLDVTLAKPGDVNEIVAPVTADEPVAVKSVKEEVPETPLFEILPPNTHAPAPTASETAAVLDVRFPY